MLDKPVAGVKHESGLSDSHCVRVKLIIFSSSTKELSVTCKSRKSICWDLLHLLYAISLKTVLRRVCGIDPTREVHPT